MKKQLATATQKRYESDSREDTKCALCHKRLIVRAWKYCQGCEDKVVYKKKGTQSENVIK